MRYQSITKPGELRAFCDELRRATSIGFDTEFVAEYTYRPVLCLVQVAVAGQLAVIDALELDDLTPFWQALADGDHETIVHAGREEMLFCLKAVGLPPNRLFDTQIAAGLVGLEYPAGYGNLIGKLLGKRPPKGETRTDWRRRPLTDRQIAYALSDVEYLQPVRDALYRDLERLGRLDWLAAELGAWQQEVDESRTNERWRKVSGSANLGSRELAIVRALWRWREGVAAARDAPARKVLRDDLIVELARRRLSSPKQIQAVRGLQRRDLNNLFPAIGRAIEEALALPDDACPLPVSRESTQHMALLSQFLTTALSAICRAANVAPALVGTASDVRELIADRQRQRAASNGLPVLLQGWRGEVVGRQLDDLLEGKLAIRVTDPASDQPLTFE